MAVAHSEAEPLGSGFPYSSAYKTGPCSQVLYHGKYVLSPLNNQGNKKLASAQGKGSRNCLINACKMVTYCF